MKMIPTSLWPRLSLSPWTSGRALDNGTMQWSSRNRSQGCSTRCFARRQGILDEALSSAEDMFKTITDELWTEWDRGRLTENGARAVSERKEAMQVINRHHFGIVSAEMMPHPNGTGAAEQALEAMLQIHHALNCNWADKTKQNGRNTGSSQGQRMRGTHRWLLASSPSLRAA